MILARSQAQLTVTIFEGAAFAYHVFFLRNYVSLFFLPGFVMLRYRAGFRAVQALRTRPVKYIDRKQFRFANCNMPGLESGMGLATTCSHTHTHAHWFWGRNLHAIRPLAACGNCASGTHGKGYC